MSSQSRTAVRTAALTLSAAALGLSALTASPAVASGDDDAVQRSGSCSAGTEWKIKAKADDGRIEVEAEIDSNKVGQSWSWKFKDNGACSPGTSTTTAPSGSFEVERSRRTGPAPTTSCPAVYPKSGEVARTRVG